MSILDLVELRGQEHPTWFRVFVTGAWCVVFLMPFAFSVGVGFAMASDSGQWWIGALSGGGVFMAWVIFLAFVCTIGPDPE